MQNSKPNFKALPSALKKQVANTYSSDAFKKAVTLIGISGVVAWTHSLLSKDLSDDDKMALEKLDISETDKASSYLLNPETMDAYFEATSMVDNAEANLWTRGLSATPTNVTLDSISSDSVNNLLSSNSSLFVENLASRKIETVLNQAKALSASGVYDVLSAKLDDKINGLVQEADKLKKDEKTSELFARLANIARMRAIATFVDLILGRHENANDEAKPLVENISQDTIVETSVLSGANLSEQEEISTPQITSSEEIQEQELGGPKVLGTINLDSLSGVTTRFPISHDEVANVEPPNVEPPITMDLKEFTYTKNNKEFIDEVFVKAFKKTSHIKPNLYADQINFIKLIYESYDKDRVRNTFLKILADSNNVKILDQYKIFTNGNPASIDFLGFYHLQNFKHSKGADVSKDEFNKLNEFRRDFVNYWTINQRENKITLTFEKGIPVSKKLEIIRDFYKIAFNVNDNSMLVAQNVNAVTVDAIKEELIKKLAQDADDYPNIVEFLDLNIEDIKSEVLKGDKEEAEEVARINLLDSPVMNKLNTLVQILNNDAFNGLMDSVHARMRFIERFVFDDPINIDKKVYNIKQITSKEVLKLQKTIENAKDVEISPYQLKRSNGTSAHKSGISIKIKNTTIGLNNSAQIHTIYE